MSTNSNRVAVSPTFVDAAGDLGAHTEPLAEIWYLTARVANTGPEAATFVVQTILTMSPSGHLVVMNAVRASGAPEPTETTEWYKSDDCAISRDGLDIGCATTSLKGTLDELDVNVTADGAAFELTCKTTRPVLFSSGSGSFPHFAGPTFQYALPALAVSGTVTIDGETFDVDGNGWLDRQWSESRDAFGVANPFIWFGLCLENGLSLSVWKARGYSWATVGNIDGSVTVVETELLSTEGGWSLQIGALDAALQLGFERLRTGDSFITGAIDIIGTLAGEKISGYGFIDEIPAGQG